MASPKQPRKCEHEPYYALGLCKKCYENQEGPKWRQKMYVKNPTHRKAKWRQYHLRDALKTFSITGDEFKRMYDSQDGLCKICLGPPIGKTRLSIDHDHVTGKVRGLLCDRCNVGLAQFKEDVKLLLRAADYLEQSK